MVPLKGGRTQLIAFALLVTITWNAASPLPVSLIHGGIDAEKGELPYMVSIQVPKPFGAEGHTPVCGGTIISLTKVVTAAHCVDNLSNYPDGTTRLVAGAHVINIKEETQQIRVINYSTKIYTHHLWNRIDSKFDIAIIEVSTPFVYNDFVKPVTLPPAGMGSSGMCLIAGWGSTENSSTSDVLRKAEIPIVPKDDCMLIYPQFHNETQICAGFDAGGVDTCLGDTGGPIICHHKSFNYFAGVSSYGYYCAQAGHPGVYTEISELINWINNPFDEETSRPIYF